MNRLISLMLIFIVFQSCFEESTHFEQTEQTQIQDDEFTVLGKKKAIAFTVENMQKAYEAILNNPTASQYPTDIQNRKNNSTFARFTDGSYQIATTHYYVKFNPQDSLQYEKIETDTILAVSDVPFEYDIELEGAKYQDPDLVGTDFTYYYSVIPVGYQLPNDVPYEKIAHLHFTSEDDIPDDAPESELQKVDFFHDLNTEALKQSDNLDEEKEELLYIFINSDGDEERLTWEEAQNRGLNLNQLIINFNEDDYDEEAKFFRRRKWRPSGTITVHEDAINQSVGVMGARVRVRKWGFLVIRKAHTNRNGYFRTSRTRTKRVKYALYFKNRRSRNIRRFTVKAGTWFWNARDRGHKTHKRRPWRRHYTYGRRQLYAFVQNAAFDYYTRMAPRYGLRIPKDRMKISAKYNRCATSQHRPAVLTLLPISRLRVTRKDEHCRYRRSDGIYATTVHELAHAGHQRMDSGMFSIFHSGSCNRAVLIESWAEGVETIITNDRYDEITNNNYQSSNIDDQNGRWNSWRQRRRSFQMNEYTPIVEDLIDDLNQFADTNDTSGRTPFDEVSGYALRQIQTALDNCRDISCWENKLNANRPAGVSAAQLQRLFDYVHYIRRWILESPCN
ncbi:MAG: hypothetical protein ACPF88_02490 [Flavobacteriaceae bacterium]